MGNHFWAVMVAAMHRGMGGVERERESDGCGGLTLWSFVCEGKAGVIKGGWVSRQRRSEGIYPLLSTGRRAERSQIRGH